MILCDRQIDSLCRGIVPKEIANFYLTMYGRTVDSHVRSMIEPYDQMMLNPASIDIRVGNTAKVLVGNGVYNDIDLSLFYQQHPYKMAPGDRVLVGSWETFYLPTFICAQFRLKSSRGREWYEHMEAGFCDPGWHGSKLTMEIINLSTDPLPLYPQLPMGQLVFSLMLDVPNRDYGVTGRYNNDKVVAQSKG